MPIETTEATREPAAAKLAADEANPRSSPLQPGSNLRVLMLEDDFDDAELVSRVLQKDGFEVDRKVVQTRDAFLQEVQASHYDLVLADYGLPQWCGIDSLELLRQLRLDIPVILVSGGLGELTAVECIKQGAADYVLKDQLARLPIAVRRALQERRLRQEHRRAQQELERSNRDLEQFAYVASHDLQEPLRMVATFTQLLAERYAGKLGDDADKYIRYATEGAVRMQTLIQDLLAFSRVGRGGIVAKSTDCNEVVGEALRNLETAILESGAVVTCEPLPVVVVDPPLLRQLFQNLIGNAIKFRRSEPLAVQVSARAEASAWIFSVTDNGIGIAEEYIETIFMIFKRLHTRAEYPGNGLGLAICKKIVEHHGGRIWVESTLGQGSTFKFVLPKRQPLRQAAPENGDHARNPVSGRQSGRRLSDL